jgi:Sulfotransferase domain
MKSTESGKSTNRTALSGRRMLATSVRSLIRFTTLANAVAIHAVQWMQLWCCRVGSRSRSEDIFIVSYPKSGTTWLQMIVFQLKSRGSEEFEHINDVIPHFEKFIVPTGKDLHELPAPWVFKSHLAYTWIPKGKGKYIYVVRDGVDVAWSYYSHHRKYIPFELRGRSFAMFFDSFLKGKVGYGSWFKHVAGWISNREKLDLLLVHYEDLIADLEGEVRRVADFCRIPLLEEDVPKILNHCSLEYMRQHERKFALEHARPPNRPNPGIKFIRTGAVGEGDSRIDHPERSAYRKLFERYLPGREFDRYRETAAARTHGS